MTRVLFVCLGNICRSPLAEGIFKQLVEDKGLSDQISCDSCGTSNYHIGDQPDPRTRSNAKQNGVVLNHKARQFDAEDFYRFDLILAMDKSNLGNILNFPESKSSNAKIQLMRDYDPDGQGLDVPDPYFGGEKGFQEVFDILNRSCNYLIDRLNS